MMGRVCQDTSSEVSTTDSTEDGMSDDDASSYLSTVVSGRSDGLEVEDCVLDMSSHGSERGGEELGEEENVQPDVIVHWE